MRERLTTCGEIAGGVMVTVGSWMLAPALGWIVGGAVTFGLSVWAADR